MRLPRILVLIICYLAQNVDGARELLQRATREPGSAKRREKLDDKPVQERVHRSTKLWCFYADLEESYGTVKTTMAVYDRILDLQIATPQIGPPPPSLPSRTRARAHGARASHQSTKRGTKKKKEKKRCRATLPPRPWPGLAHAWPVPCTHPPSLLMLQGNTLLPF